MKHYKPTTPGRRGMSADQFRGILTGDRPYKPLTKGVGKRGGRNAYGRITMRHRGGGHKQKFRLIDFRFEKRDIPAVIETIEYDPNRSAYIARVLYRDGERRYVIVPRSMSPGDMFVVSETAPIQIGNRLPLAKIPVGTFVYNIEIKPGSGGKIARGAGSYAEVVAKDAGYVDLKLPSTEVRKVLETSWASIGEVWGSERKLRSLGKAGRSRWLGIRPTVRGSAMNPVDHPHGGGEGRSGRGRRRAVSKWGKGTGKGQKSRRPGKYSSHLIVSRRRVGKKK